MYSALKRLVVGPPIASSTSTTPASASRRVWPSCIRRDLVHGLRDRGDPARTDACGRHGRAQRPRAHLDRRRDPARLVITQLPPDDLRLSRTAAVRTSSAARTSGRSRRWSPARRCWSTTSSRSRCRSRRASPPSPRRSRPRGRTGSSSASALIAADDAGEPPRHQGVRPDLRAARLPLHPEPHAADRLRALPVVLRRPRRRCRPIQQALEELRQERRADRRPIFRRLVSSCSCGPSRPARSR